LFERKVIIQAHIKTKIFGLMGLGDASIGNFSTDQISNIKITAQNYRRILKNTGRPRRGVDGQNLRLRIIMDCIWVNLKHVGLPFSNLRYVSLYMYQSVNNTAGRSFSVVTLP